MIAPETVAEIRRLFYAEHWKIGTIAAALCLHAETVKHALRAVVPFARTPKPRVLEPYEAFVRETLQRHPRLRATRLLEMLRDRGFIGSIHQLRRGVKALRPATREAFFRLTTLPGEQAQVDWVHIPKEREKRFRRVKGNFEQDERRRISTNVKGFALRSKFLFAAISTRER